MDFELTDAAVWEAVDKLIADMQRQISPYLVALVTSAFAAAANVALWPALGSRYPLIAFCPAIVASSWFGGWSPGILSAIFAAVATSYSWFAPLFLTSSTQQRVAIVLTMCVALGLMIAAIYEAVTRPMERGAQAGAKPSVCSGGLTVRSSSEIKKNS